MHQPIKKRLEEYFSGTADAATEHEIEEHLANCADCRKAVEKMRGQSVMIRTLRPPEESDPSPGFYARVIERIESQRVPSLWELFLDPAFGRRLVYALMTLFVLLGTLLVTGGGPAATTSAAGYYSPETFLAEKPVAPYIGVDPEHDREVVLVNLASYED